MVGSSWFPGRTTTKRLVCKKTLLWLLKLCTSCSVAMRRSLRPLPPTPSPTPSPSWPSDCGAGTPRVQRAGMRTPKTRTPAEPGRSSCSRPKAAVPLPPPVFHTQAMGKRAGTLWKGKKGGRIILRKQGDASDPKPLKRSGVMLKHTHPSYMFLVEQQWQPSVTRTIATPRAAMGKSGWQPPNSRGVCYHGDNS